MTPMQIEQQVRQFLLENFIFDSAVQLGLDDSLMENGIMDSTGVLELIMWLEQSLGVPVADHEVLPENLDSISNLANYVGRKLAGKLAPAA